MVVRCWSWVKNTASLLPPQADAVVSPVKVCVTLFMVQLETN
jgi:hypothetical protein